jgi:hypothetical protein
MVKNGFKIVVFLYFLIVLAGCTTMSNSNPGIGYFPGLELEVKRKAEVIDNVEARARQTIILGFIKLGDKNVGTISNITGVSETTSRDIMSVGSHILGNKRDVMSAALYKCIEQAWDKGADLILPLASTIKVQNYFFFKKETATVKGKALKILNQ